MSRRAEAGFTLVEVAIVVVILCTIMGAVWNTSISVSSTVTENDRSAEVVTDARATMRRIAKFVRPCKMSSITVQAIEDDVTAGVATTVGEWIYPTDAGTPPGLVWRPGMRFVSASGTESMNAALSTSPRELTFALDSGEVANGADDDGDGLVDEGVVRLVHDHVTIAVVADVEECMFQIDGRLLAVRLRCGKSDTRGGARRAQIVQHFYLRNN